MLKNVESVAKSFSDVEEVKKAIRSLQSRKSRLKKQKSREDYDELMTEILQQEQLLKEVRDYFEPKKTPVTQMTKKDIEQLNYDETIRASKSESTRVFTVDQGREICQMLPSFTRLLLHFSSTFFYYFLVFLYDQN